MIAAIVRFHAGRASASRRPRVDLGATPSVVSGSRSVASLRTLGRGLATVARRQSVKHIHQRWSMGVGEIFADDSFCEDKDHPNDIDGYFVCDARDLGRLQRELNLLDPYKVWTWDARAGRGTASRASCSSPCGTDTESTCESEAGCDPQRSRVPGSSSAERGSEGEARAAPGRAGARGACA